MLGTTIDQTKNAVNGEGSAMHVLPQWMRFNRIQWCWALFDASMW
jgi:hypothetical protein